MALHRFAVSTVDLSRLQQKIHSSGSLYVSMISLTQFVSIRAAYAGILTVQESIQAD